MKMSGEQKAKIILDRYKDIIPEYNDFLNTVLSDASKVIRINSLRTSPEYIRRRLEEIGVELEEISWYRNAFLVREGKEKVSRTLEYHLGLYYMMDLVSLIPPLILRGYVGSTTLDIAAAPGGKALMIAEVVVERGIVIANDPDPSRYKALISNIDRMGYPNILVTQVDGRRFPPVRGLDAVLFDAPCSSEIHIKSVKDVVEYQRGRIYIRYSKLQVSILKRLYDILQPDSIVLYSVCTFNPLESEHVVKKATEIGFKVERIPWIPLKYTGGIRRWNHMEFPREVEHTIRIYPHLNQEYGNPGYLYMALLRR